MERQNLPTQSIWRDCVGKFIIIIIVIIVATLFKCHISLAVIFSSDTGQWITENSYMKIQCFCFEILL